MKVDSVMSRDVATCQPNESMADAARRMGKHDCGVLPVLEDGRLAGVVTDRDICMSAAEHGKPLAELPVRKAMSGRPAVVREGDGCDAVHKVMRETRVRRVPVVDSKAHVVGIVSLNDLCLGAEAGSGPDRDLHRKELASTLARICEHRPEARA
jgi:CBS domain-containing protein